MNKKNYLDQNNYEKIIQLFRLCVSFYSFALALRAFMYMMFCVFNSLMLIIASNVIVLLKTMDEIFGMGRAFKQSFSVFFFARSI